MKKKVGKFLLTGLIMIFMIPSTYAQVADCNHSEVRKKLMEKLTPEQKQVVKEAEVKLEDFTQQFIEQKKSQKALKTLEITIPVVVHVVHDYGPEYIDEYQIIDAIDQMTEDFHAYPYAGSIDGFGYLQANVGFTFKLATIDPWGNPTNGITYTASTTTYNGTEGPLQSTINWPREKYLNIWVVNSSDGTGTGSAYSNYPSTVANGTGNEYWDGIVCSYWAVGRTGTAIPTHYKILTHEAGHWANLKHTWGDQTDWGTSAACYDDDDVSDTPNTSGNTGCSSNYTCGTADNTENLMDYGSCTTMFTFGQSARMEAAMNSSVADRNNLWTEANLIATGVYTGPPSCYCSSFSSSAADEWIENVTVGSFTNTSGASTYTDFTSTQTINLTTGQSYNVSFTPGFNASTYAEYFKMWIDFNGDCDFNDPGELVYDAGSTSTTTVNGSINIPSSAPAGETRARVSMRFQAAPGPCDTPPAFDDGEVEDYKVIITTGGGTDTQPPTAPTGLSASNVSGTTVDLSWVASTDNVGVTGYDIFHGTTNVGTSTGTSYTAGGLTPNTTYTFTVKAKDAAGNVSAASNSVTVTTTTGGCSYCASGSIRSTYEHIAGVQVGNFNNTSGAANYTDFTNVTIDVSKEQSYNITLTPGFSSGAYNEYFKMWIDFNGNCDFTDPGELVFDAGSPSSSAVNGTINIPSSAITGTTRARVSMRYNAAPEACMAAVTFDDGEVEDYTVNISGGGGSDTQAPTAPSNLNASNVTQTSVNLSWNASTDNVGITGYDIFSGSKNVGTTINTSFTVTGLATGSSYTFTVKAKDAAGNVSAASNAVNVTTTGGTVTYCSSLGNNSSYEWIAGLQLGNFSNSSGAAGYTDFTSQTISLGSGTNNVTLTPGFSGSSYTEYWRIWIDFNKNGNFTDAGEEVFSGNGSGNVSGTINVPSGNTGTTRMRVSMKYNATPTSCEAFTYGEVEDYTVSFSPAGAPLNLSEKEGKTFTVYPNPNDGTFKLSYTSEEKGKMIVNIFSTNGQLVKQRTMEKVLETMETEFNLQGLQPGVYNLQIISGESVMNQKIIIK